MNYRKKAKENPAFFLEDFEEKSMYLRVKQGKQL